jgi:hypothetical protein
VNPWTCAMLITATGGLGGAINALITGNGFIPELNRGTWRPGRLASVQVKAHRSCERAAKSAPVRTERRGSVSPAALVKVSPACDWVGLRPNYPNMREYKPRTLVVMVMLGLIVCAGSTAVGRPAVVQ